MPLAGVFGLGRRCAEIDLTRRRESRGKDPVASRQLDKPVEVVFSRIALALFVCVHIGKEVVARGGGVDILVVVRVVTRTKEDHDLVFDVAAGV